MDTAPLVMDEIDAGVEFIRAFDQVYRVCAAFWLKASDEGVRYLYLASDQFTDANVDAAYEEVLRTAGRISGHMDPFRVRLIAADDPLARTALDVYRRSVGRIPSRFAGPIFGGIPVDEVYLYPPPTP